MKKLVMAGAALAMMASTAIAERYVMITHKVLTHFGQ